MQVLVKNWLVGAEKTEVAHLWAAMCGSNIDLAWYSVIVIFVICSIVLGELREFARI